MSRANPLLLIVALLVFLAVFAGSVILKGGLYLDAYELDSYHLMDILFRMHEGARLYLDFVTPLGLLSLLPITALMDAGLSVGAAIAWSQVLVAACLFPVLVYTALTRFEGPLAYLFGVLVLGLATAITYGGANSGVSFAMYYNRWAWSVSFVMLALAILPPLGRDRPAMEGAMIGVGAAVLLLLKITYFVAILPAVGLLLLLRRDWARLLAAIVVAVLIAAVVTFVFGAEFWAGYLRGLLNVLGSPLRPSGGMPLNEVVAGNAYIAGTLLAVVAVIMVSRAGHDRISLALVLLIPGFFFVTYQNFGSDPQWLMFLPFLLLPLRPEAGKITFAGLDLRLAMGGASAIAIALIAPSMINLLLSPLNHAAFQEEAFEPMLPARPAHSDLLIRKDRAHLLAALQYLDDDATSSWSSIDGATAASAELLDVAFPRCELQAATLAFYTTVTDDLAKAGIAEGSRIFTADLSRAFWLFGPYEPLPGDAPWYYGGLTGIENADYLLVPKCSFVRAIRDIMIQEVIDADLSLTLVRDNDLYALFRLN